ncbi:MAG: FAD binding domain-containing protein [Acidiferrobacter sp.]
MSVSWYAPRHIEEALTLLAERPGLIPIAGGTDVMVDGNAGAAGREYLSLAGIADLRGVRETPLGLAIGALTTMTEIGRHPLVCRHLPALAASAQVTGAVAIQNRATLGGNIMNASPAADNPPVLLAYGASVVLMSAMGPRHVPYAQFHSGYKETVRWPTEILGEVIVPFPPDKAHHYFRKVGTRRAQAISKVGLAAVLAGRPGSWECVRFGFASVAATPILACALAAAITGSDRGVPRDEELAEALGRDIAARDDIRSTADYRRRVAINLVREAVAPWRSQGGFDASH